MRLPDEIRQTLIRPCVYAWCRANVCLYVGSTSRGIDGRCIGHTVIDFQIGDELRVWWCEITELHTLEREIIAELQPARNKRPVPTRLRWSTRRRV